MERNVIDPLVRGGEWVEYLARDVTGTINHFSFTMDGDSFPIASRDRGQASTDHYRSKADLIIVGRGSMAVTDWLFTRRRAKHWDIEKCQHHSRPRLHIYAVEGPFGSTQVLANTNDVYGRRLEMVADIFLGTASRRPAWRGKRYREISTNQRG